MERLVDGVAEDQVPAPQDAAANRPKQDRQRWEKKISCKPIIFSPPHYVPYFRVMDPDRFWLFGQLFNQLSRIFITMGMGMSISLGSIQYTCMLAPTPGQLQVNTLK